VVTRFASSECVVIAVTGQQQCCERESTFGIIREGLHQKSEYLLVTVMMKSIASLLEMAAILVMLVVQVGASMLVSFGVGLVCCYVYSQTLYTPLPPGAKDCNTGGMAPFLLIQFLFLVVGTFAGVGWWFNTTFKDYIIEQETNAEEDDPNK